MHSKTLFAFCLIAASRVSAHGAITAVSGTNGETGSAFGVDAATPRDGTRRNPFQTDSSIIRDREIASGKSSACGRTLAGGNNEIAAAMTQAESAGIPSVGADGKVEMVLHQVNGDGGGPYSCDVNASGDGKDFVPMKVDTNVPGKNSRSNAKAEDIPLVASMPNGMQCTGGADGQTCIVRCRNAANAGPFGGCVAVTQNEGNKKAKRDLESDALIESMIKQAEAAEEAEEGEQLFKRETNSDKLLEQMIEQAEAAEAAEEGETLVKRAQSTDQLLENMIEQAEAAEAIEEGDVLVKREQTADEILDEMVRQAELAELAFEDTPPIKKRALTAEEQIDQLVKQAELAEEAEELIA